MDPSLPTHPPPLRQVLSPHLILVPSAHCALWASDHSFLFNTHTSALRPCSQPPRALLWKGLGGPGYSVFPELPSHSPPTCARAESLKILLLDLQTPDLSQAPMLAGSSEVSCEFVLVSKEMVFGQSLCWAPRIPQECQWPVVEAAHVRGQARDHMLVQRGEWELVPGHATQRQSPALPLSLGHL